MYTAVPESPVGKPQLTPPAITVVGVSKEMAGRKVLNDVSLTIPRGRIHGLLGPNGSGKTSLLRILAGLWRPDAGRIERHHGSVAEIGYVAQRFCLYDELTVRENLRFQRAMRGAGRETVAQAEADFDLIALRDQRAGRLSGGERQRLMIAAALLHRPSLLLLDEPTTALDAPSRRFLWALLHRETTAGATVVLTTHEEADARECHATTVLRDGRVLVPGLSAHEVGR